MIRMCRQLIWRAHWDEDEKESRFDRRRRIPRVKNWQCGGAGNKTNEPTSRECSWTMWQCKKLASFLLIASFLFDFFSRRFFHSFFFFRFSFHSQREPILHFILVIFFSFFATNSWQFSFFFTRRHFVLFFQRCWAHQCNNVNKIKLYQRDECEWYTEFNEYETAALCYENSKYQQ